MNKQWSRGLPRYLWEMELRGVFMPPYSMDLRRGRVEFFSHDFYILFE
jgi:hypothetical protein